VSTFLTFPRTVRGRLLAVSAVSILAAVAVFTALTIMLVGHQLRSSLDGALRTRAQEAAQLAVSAPALLTDPGALESPVSGREIAVEVLDARGTILARSLTLGARLLPQDPLVRAARIQGRSGYEDIRIGGRDYRLFVAPIAQAGGPAAGGAVLVASDTTDIHDTISHLGVALTVSGAAIALIAALIAAGLTRRGLRPLRRLAAGAEEIERTADPARRLPDTGEASDEIAQLTGVLNRMLASLERSRANERRFLADASHELRTPVTSLLGNVHYARRHGADGEVLADIDRDAERLARLVDDLLVLERQAGDGAGTDSPVELDRLVHTVELDRLVQTVAAEHGAIVRLGTLEPVRLRGDEEALRRVVANLVENAVVHGPTGEPVDVSLTRHDAVARLDVSDRGPGPDPEMRERVFERFWRAPEAAGRPGSGLGLAITQAIVARYGGTITVDGSTFTVELPVADAEPAPGDVA
jgi:signal transduction histidine kinase